MTFQQELNSWLSPKAVTTSPVPEINSKAPSSSKLTIPPSNGKATIITFLRHCGCPFAEKTFVSLRSLAAEDSTRNYIAVSHSSPSSTEKWLASIDGPGKVQVIVDDSRELHAAWGLGVSDVWHVLNPWAMYSLYTLGKKEGIWNKPTESGSRWQTAGSFAVDAEGKVKWEKVAKAADEIPDFGEASREV